MNAIIRLYGPAIVLLMMAVGETLNLNHYGGFALLVLALSVIVHIRQVIREHKK